ncbi:hypothetical protein GGH92_009599, partial [Coemansia sp. RSA 2673]
RWVFPWLAPTVAKFGRIVKYLARRHFLRNTRHRYSKVSRIEDGPMSDSAAGGYGRAPATPSKPRFDLRTGEPASAIGSSSATINGAETDMAYSADGGDLEDGRSPPTWEEIARKTDSKPYKRILREMGIPAWY